MKKTIFLRPMKEQASGSMYRGAYKSYDTLDEALSDTESSRGRLVLRAEVEIMGKAMQKLALVTEPEMGPAYAECPSPRKFEPKRKTYNEDIEGDDLDEDDL